MTKLLILFSVFLVNQVLAQSTFDQRDIVAVLQECGEKKVDRGSQPASATNTTENESTFFTLTPEAALIVKGEKRTLSTIGIVIGAPFAFGDKICTPESRLLYWAIRTGCGEVATYLDLADFSHNDCDIPREEEFFQKLTSDLSWRMFSVD